MIPKVIHYCWFGRNPLPKEALRCIRSWKICCPDYEIIQWNEDNFDLSKCPVYVQQAYEAKKWAFVSDYARLKIIYENGGIYVDTDVEFLKAPDSLLSHKAYFGFEDAGIHINTGLGFGAEKGTAVLKRMMADYADIPFINPDGTPDETTCPQRNTAALLELGMKREDMIQVLPGDILILPREYLCPVGYWHHTDCITENSISVHWYTATWLPDEYRRQRADKLKKLKRQRQQERLRLLPKQLAYKLIGEKNLRTWKKG